MFQYAAGKRLAVRHGTVLKIDLSAFSKLHEGDTPRQYELGHLMVEAVTAGPGECRKYRTDSLLQKVGLGVLAPMRIQERHFQFSPSVLAAPDNVYLDGYWQSEKYFRDIEDVIRKEFTVRYPLAGKNLEICSMIRSSNSIFLHVRRGDYVSSRRTNEYHGVCGMGYYNTAVEAISKRIHNPHFFIFSDEPDWAEKNLTIPFKTTYVSHNGVSGGHEDMRLMTMCRHGIIANSSFSWWGAWLSSTPEKIIIAPGRWFAQDGIDTRDLIPESWIRI